MGPPKLMTPVTLLYAGFAVFWPVVEKFSASNDELSICSPMLPLYSDRGPRRLLPNGAESANGELAALLVEPLISNPSEALLLRSAALWPANASDVGAGVSPDAAGAVDAAFTSVLRN